MDPAGFRTGRDLAAWIGLTPRSSSSGGKERLGAISKRGNKQLRTLLVVGATSVLKQARRGAEMDRRAHGPAAQSVASEQAFRRSGAGKGSKVLKR
jgi:transposase